VAEGHGTLLKMPSRSTSNMAGPGMVLIDQPPNLLRVFKLYSIFIYNLIFGIFFIYLAQCKKFPTD
jgi:hypothetical protein